MIRRPMAAQVTHIRQRLPRPPKPEGGVLESLRPSIENFDARRDWFIEGLFEGNQIVLVIAKEKSGKSWLMHDMAVSVASGEAFLDRFPVRRPGPVVLLDAEYGPHETSRRIIRLARAHGRDAIELADDIDYVYARGWTLKQGAETDDDGNRKRSFGDAQRLARELSNMRRAGDPGPALVIIDPLRNFLAGNENDAECIGDFFRGLELLRDVARCPIVVCHHLNKSGSFSGSRALMSRADLILEGTDEDQPWYSATGRTIRRNDAIAERFTIAIEHEDDDDDSKAKTFVRVRFASEAKTKSELRSATRKVLAIVKEHGPISQNSIREHSRPQMSGRTVKDCLSELEKLGYVEQGKGGWEASTAEVFNG